MSTHCLIVDIKIGQGFEIDGEKGQGDHGTRRQWERIKIDDDDLLNGKILAKVIGGYTNDGNVELFDSQTMVRPHSQNC